MDLLKQKAEVFKFITELWICRSKKDAPLNFKPGSGASIQSQSLEFNPDQNESNLNATILQFAQELSTEELQILRIQLAKAFLKELDRKLEI